MKISPYVYPSVEPDFKEKSAEEIIDIICVYFDVSLEKVKSKERYQNFVLARQWCCWFIKASTDLRLKDISAFFNRDHTTVIHSIEFIKNQLSLKAPTKYHKHHEDLNKLIYYSIF